MTRPVPENIIVIGEAPGVDVEGAYSDAIGKSPHQLAVINDYTLLKLRVEVFQPSPDGPLRETTFVTVEHSIRLRGKE
jgi:hypothetical protein